MHSFVLGFSLKATADLATVGGLATVVSPLSFTAFLMSCLDARPGAGHPFDLTFGVKLICEARALMDIQWI